MTELVSAIRAAGTATLPLSTLAAMPLFSKNSPGSPLMPPPSREYIAKARASPPKKLAPLALPSADISDDAAKVPRGKIEMQPALLAEFAGLIDAIGPAICQLLPGEAGLAKGLQHIFKAVVEQQKRNYQNHSIKASKLVSVRDVRLGVIQDVFFAPHESCVFGHSCYLHVFQST